MSDTELNENKARERNRVKMEERSDLEVEEQFTSTPPKPQTQETMSPTLSAMPPSPSSQRLSSHVGKYFSNLPPSVIGIILVVGVCNGLFLMSINFNNGKALIKYQEEINDLEGRTVDNELEMNVLKSRLEVLEYEIFEAKKLEKETRNYHPSPTNDNQNFQKPSNEADRKLANEIEKVKIERDELLGRYEKEVADLKRKVNEKDEELKKLKTQVGGLERQIKSNKVELMRKTKQNKLLRDEHEKEVAGLKEDRLTLAKGYLSQRVENEDITNDFLNTFRMYRVERGDTELHLAAFFKKDDKVRELIEEGDEDVDVNARNKDLATPLHRAAIGSTYLMQGLTVIKYLIKNGADVYLKDKNNKTFLHDLLDRNETSLSPAEFHEFAEYLIGKQFTNLFDIKDGIYGSTPLHLAVRQLELEERTLTLLYRNGVNFNALNGAGDVLLVYAIEGRRTPGFLTSLMKFGRDWSWGQLNHNNRSLAYYAAFFGNVDALSFILAKGVDVNGRDVNGDTPLHGAVIGMNNVFETVLFLLQHWADPNLRSKEGFTPLSFAMTRDDLEDKDRIVALLRANM